MRGKSLPLFCSVGSQLQIPGVVAAYGVRLFRSLLCVVLNELRVPEAIWRCISMTAASRPGMAF